MAELLHLDRRFWNYANQETHPPQEQTVMRLYCWPCRTVHPFAVADVERIVYALGAAELLAHGLRAETETDDQRAEAQEMADAGPTCLSALLDCSGDPEVFGEHVEQAVECRQASHDG
jgi:hypothetical protein